MRLRLPICAALALVASTSAALADPAPTSAAPRPLLRLARPADDVSSPYASPVKDPGPNLGHTAVERRLSGDGVTGSVGYLCGIDLYQPDGWQRGGGVDSSAGHKGTFLGAKLGYSFK
jgi:hypothetical protein